MIAQSRANQKQKKGLTSMFESLKNVVKGTVGQTALGAVIGLAIYDGVKYGISKLTSEPEIAPRKKHKKATAKVVPA